METINIDVFPALATLLLPICIVLYMDQLLQRNTSFGVGASWYHIHEGGFVLKSLKEL